MRLYNEKYIYSNTGFNKFGLEKEMMIMTNEIIKHDEIIINICRDIRMMANFGQIKYFPEVRDEKNLGMKMVGETYFIKYLDYCGMDADKYVWEYCLCLQPYMIESYYRDDKRITAICSIYGISSTYVRVEYDCDNATNAKARLCPRCLINQNGEIMVENVTGKNSLETLQVYMFGDRICSILENTRSGEPIYVIDIMVQCGIKMLPITLGVTKDGAGFRVRRMSYIKQEIEKKCLEYLEAVYSSELDLDYENVTLFTDLQYLPIRAEGRNVFLNISFLVELLTKCRDYQTIGLTDFALVGYVNSLIITSEMKNEIIDMLEQKYGTGESKVLVERVRDCLEGSGVV